MFQAWQGWLLFVGIAHISGLCLVSITCQRCPKLGHRVADLCSSRVKHEHLAAEDILLCAVSAYTKITSYLGAFLVVHRQLYRWPCYSLTSSLQDIFEIPKNLKKHYHRALWETCDPWVILSEWWGDKTFWGIHFEN